MTSLHQIPSTPRVISPSPTPSEHGAKDGYFPPTTRSKTVGTPHKSVVTPIEEYTNGGLPEDDPEMSRARPRSRRTHTDKKTHTNGGINTEVKAGMPFATGAKPTRQKQPQDTAKPAKGEEQGMLSPSSAYGRGGLGAKYWRSLSRSPSPLGLIPIHRNFRAFIHKHEVPRKALHVSIGFITLYLYHAGIQTSQIHPVLLSMLIPIFSLDIIRFRWPAFNELYIKVMGAFMRESEAHDRFNGVISYLAGLWATMYFCKKDVAVMSVLLLSWCDTAASTFGRLYGKYTPRIRRGKSLAGSIACFLFGVAAAVLFWGYIAPRTDEQLNQGVNRFAFQGHLVLPLKMQEILGWNQTQATISGSLALAIVSLASGLIASVSEALVFWNLDDNLTLPIFCGLGLGVFLHVFGGS